MIKRIQRIADYADRIYLSNEDAVTLVQRLNNELSHNTLFYLDPPYYNTFDSYTLYQFDNAMFVGYLLNVTNNNRYRIILSNIM